MIWEPWYPTAPTVFVRSGILTPEELVEVFVYKGTIKVSQAACSELRNHPLSFLVQSEAEEKVTTRFGTQPRTGKFHIMERRRQEFRKREARSPSRLPTRVDDLRLPNYVFCPQRAFLGVHLASVSEPGLPRCGAVVLLPVRAARLALLRRQPRVGRPAVPRNSTYLSRFRAATGRNGRG